jgi:hypothetical protein
LYVTNPEDFREDVEEDLELPDENFTEEDYQTPAQKTRAELRRRRRKKKLRDS